MDYSNALFKNPYEYFSVKLTTAHFGIQMLYSQWDDFVLFPKHSPFLYGLSEMENSASFFYIL